MKLKVLSDKNWVSNQSNAKLVLEFKESFVKISFLFYFNYL